MACRKYLKKTKEFDWFGYPVALGFKGEGSTYKTFWGGILSILLRLLLGTYLALRARTVVLRGEKEINLFKETTDFEALGEVQVSAENAGVIFYFELTDFNHVYIPLNEVSRYVKLTSMVTEIDF